MISPALFRRFLLPRYKRITDLLHRYGVDVVYVDCDGDINLLVEPWLEAGSTACSLWKCGRVRTRLRSAGAMESAFCSRRGEQNAPPGGTGRHPPGDQQTREYSCRRGIHPVHRPSLSAGCGLPDYLYYLKVKRDAFGILHQKDRAA